MVIERKILKQIQNPNETAAGKRLVQIKVREREYMRISKSNKSNIYTHMRRGYIKLHF